jgi:hypothetical protein
VCLRRAGAPASIKVLHWLGLENNIRYCFSLNTGMKTIKSFGCSFVYGSDLEDANIEATDFVTGYVPSLLTWPALISQKLNLEYHCYALPGQGNFKIYTDILANSYANDGSIYLINWTWIDRFDYVDQEGYWKTLRPAQENHEQKFYYRHLHSQLCDTILTASYIVSAAEHLKSLNCPFIMTYMDHNLIVPIDPSWHDPRYLEVLQHKLRQILVDFDGKNFLDWSRENNFEVSSQWHPLESAHAAAAEYWLPAIRELL